MGLFKSAETVRTEKKKPQIISSKKIYNTLARHYPKATLGWVRDVGWGLEQVPLAKIQMARRPGGREPDKVKGIAEAIKSGKKMDPVFIVKLPDGRYKVADGYHRTLGTQKANKKTISAYVGYVPYADGPWNKEMHDKKLNVGKKAEEEDEMYLTKLANEYAGREDRLMQGIEDADEQYYDLDAQRNPDVVDEVNGRVMKGLGIGTLGGAGIGALAGAPSSNKLVGASLGGLAGLVGGGAVGAVRGHQYEKENEDPELLRSLEEASNKRMQARQSLENHHDMQMRYHDDASRRLAERNELLGRS